ncbi:MAG: hypothetical protein KME59_25505 [Trichormus sp. ATA11-4-KO1]|jgi:hypothetical protein|nr:hypothetical protein [Trichormus sp. ATA11-4-KO1]
MYFNLAIACASCVSPDGHCHDAKTAADKVAVTVPEIDEDYLNCNLF